MRTENEIRNSPDNTDDKIMAVLEYFLSLHKADEIFNMINDSQFDVSDVKNILDNF